MRVAGNLNLGSYICLSLSLSLSLSSSAEIPLASFTEFAFPTSRSASEAVSSLVSSLARDAPRFADRSERVPSDRAFNSARTFEV